MEARDYAPPSRGGNSRQCVEDATFDMSSKGGSKNWSKWEWNDRRQVYQRTQKNKKGKVINTQYGQANTGAGPPTPGGPRYIPQADLASSLAGGEAQDELGEHNEHAEYDEQEEYYTHAEQAPTECIEQQIETERPDRSSTPKPEINQDPSASFSSSNPQYGFQRQNKSQTGQNALPESQTGRPSASGYQQLWDPSTGQTGQYYGHSGPHGNVQGQYNYTYANVTYANIPAASAFAPHYTASQAQHENPGYDSSRRNMQTSIPSHHYGEMTSPSYGPSYWNPALQDGLPGYFSPNPGRGEQQTPDLSTDAATAPGNPYPRSDSVSLNRQNFFPGSRNFNLSISQSRSENAAFDAEDLVGETTIETTVRSQSRRLSSTYSDESRPHHQDRRSRGASLDENPGSENPVGDMTRHLRDTKLADRSVSNVMNPGLGECSPAENHGAGYENPQGYQVQGWSSESYTNPIAGNQPTKTPPQPGRPQHSKRLSDVEGQFIISTQNPKSKDESLHPEFKVCKSKTFQKGTVFKILWSEPFGDGGQTAPNRTTVDDESCIQPSKHGQKSYHSVRRFIVVKLRTGHCLCVPILTYRKQGTTKPGVKAEDHAIIYSTENPPPEIKGEKDKGLHKRPIKMNSHNNRHKLEPESRINYSKVYTVEHDVRVCFIGKIHDDHLVRFFTDFNNTFQES